MFAKLRSVFALPITATPSGRLYKRSAAANSSECSTKQKKNITKTTQTFVISAPHHKHVRVLYELSSLPSSRDIYSIKLWTPFYFLASSKCFNTVSDVSIQKCMCGISVRCRRACRKRKVQPIESHKTK